MSFGEGDRPGPAEEWVARCAAVFRGHHRSLSMFLCKRGWLEVGVDAVWVGGGQLGEGLFPVGGGLALDEAGLGPALAGGFASVSFAFESAFVLDVADRQPQ